MQRFPLAIFLSAAFLSGSVGAAAGPTAADVARAIREAGLDVTACYRVRDLSYSKEDIKLYFNEGYLIFSKPVEGQRFAAVFFGDVEGGDGEVLLLPPTRSERQSLAKFTNSPNLDEHFRNALMVFTDDTATTLLDRIVNEGGGKLAPEMGPVLADQWNFTVANVGDGFSLRVVQDLLRPVRSRGGFFLAAMVGKQLGNFDVLYDPLSPEQIVAAKFSDRTDKIVYDFWASFPSRSARNGAPLPRAPEFSVEQYRIDANLDDALRMKATTRVGIRIGPQPQRVFPFMVSLAMDVTGARIDGVPAEVFRRSSARGRALHPGENDTFLVVTPEALAASSQHQIEFEHEGNIITSPGKGVYYVGARSNWYPSTPDGFATYDLLFHYPKRLTLVTPGDIVEDSTEGDRRSTRRRTPRIHIAGFNLGEYEKYSGSGPNANPGFALDVYGNRNLEPALQPRPTQTVVLDPRTNPRAARPTVTTILQTPTAPDPLARLHAVADDVSAALQFYTGMFGAPPLKTLTVSPIPDTFGQGFPGLIYLSTLAYLDPNERPVWGRGPRQQVFFSDLIQAHEVAHQWWGGLVSPESYQDEWLMEALSQYSALLWLEKKKGPKAAQSVLEDYRDELLKPLPDGHTPESAGPLTWGFRLESGLTQDAWRIITYAKGAWILHMLRQRMGDERFLKMLAELRRRYEYSTVSTRQFQALAKEFQQPRTPADAIDVFFDNWVYSTGVPALKVKSATRTVPSATAARPPAAANSTPSATPAPVPVRVTGTVEQSDVDSDFSVDVPVEIQFAKGAPQIVWVRTASEPVPFATTVREAPLRVVIGAGSTVLAIRK